MAQNKGQQALIATEGAKYAYVIAGFLDQPLRILVNLNCEILNNLGHTRAHLAKMVGTRLQEIAVINQTTGTAGTITGSTRDIAEDVIESEALIELKKLAELKSMFDNTNSEQLELFDAAGSSMNCAQV